MSKKLASVRFEWRIWVGRSSPLEPDQITASSPTIRPSPANSLILINPVGRVGTTRYIDFRIVDLSGNPVTGLALGNFTTYFTRNGSTCSDVLALADKGTGRYLASYIPLAAGFDFVELYNLTNDVRIQDAEQIDTPETFFGISATTVNLTQDYGFVGALQLTGIAQPQTYTIYLFRSQDWQSGNTAVPYAIAATPVDTRGNWVTTPLILNKDTYHVVAMNAIGAVFVLSSFLQVQ